MVVGIVVGIVGAVIGGELALCATSRERLAAGGDGVEDVALGEHLVEELQEPPELWARAGDVVVVRVE